MGLLWLISFGEKDTPIVEEIAKLHKVDVKLVKVHYENMLKEIEKDLKK